MRAVTECSCILLQHILGIRNSTVFQSVVTHSAYKIVFQDAWRVLVYIKQRMAFVL